MKYVTPQELTLNCRYFIIAVGSPHLESGRSSSNSTDSQQENVGDVGANALLFRTEVQTFVDACK